MISGDRSEPPEHPFPPLPNTVSPPRLSLWPGVTPKVLGPYKISKVLGEGGMGVVYLGEQTSPVRRVAALKVIRVGMNTRDLVTRFEAERQALALMNHPNIAKVYDVGTTDDERPYFAMEFVDGATITARSNDRQWHVIHELRIRALFPHAG